MGSLAICAESCSFTPSQRVFKLVALLVPGFPSLDVKLYSPGVTQRKECRFKIFEVRFFQAFCQETECLQNRKSAIDNRKLVMPVRYGRFEMPKTLSKEEKGDRKSTRL